LESTSGTIRVDGPYSKYFRVNKRISEIGLSTVTVYGYGRIVYG